MGLIKNQHAKPFFLALYKKLLDQNFHDALQYELNPHFSEVYSKKDNLSALPVYVIRSERIIITTGTCLLDGGKCKKLEK
jgi:hypothetical protein